MPYITQAKREALETGEYPETSGELNYLITKQLQPLLPAFRHYIATQPKRYQSWNDLFGAMFGACLEFIRRAFPDYAHYEDKKRKENGDVWY